MRNRARILIAACGCAIAAANAGSAPAAYDPQLLVAERPDGTATIRVRVPAGSDPTARVQLYVPPGYDANFSQPPGTTIGQASVTTAAGGPVTGSVVAVPPAATSDCVAGQPAAQWEIRTPAPAIPVYVYPAAGAEALFGSYRLVACASAQARLLDLALTLRGVFSAPSGGGQTTWTGIFTPYSTTGEPSAPASREAQSLVLSPQRVVLRVRQKGRQFFLSGEALEGHRPSAAVRVQIFRGGSSRRTGRYPMRLVATRTTDIGGRYAHQIRFRARGWVRFQARALAPAPDVANGQAVEQARTVPCQDPKPAFAPAGCTNAKVAGFDVRSSITRPYRIR